MSAETAKVRGARLVGTLPDAGPWHLSVFGDRVYAVSESSGRLFAVDADGLREVSLVRPSSALFYAERPMTADEVRQRYGWGTGKPPRPA